MKTNSIISALALCTGFVMASCSQEEIVSGTSSSGKVSVQVNIPVSDASSRIMPTVPDGYQLRCMMDLVDASGKVINGTTRQVVPVTSDNITFMFDAPEGEYSCLFWADYVPVASDVNVDNLYTTTDLTAVGYAKTGNELFNDASADAFYGSVSSALIGNAVNLTRPFARVNVAPASEVADQYAAYDQVAVSYAAPSGFNVMTGSTTTTTEVSFSGSTSENYWFSSYIFTSANKTTLEGNMSLTLTDSDTSEKELKLRIAGAAITVDGNQHVNVNVTPTEGGDTEVTVTLPGDMQDPNKSYQFKVGDYVNAQGELVAEATDAVAVVFATADEKADASNYEGKTPQAYAVSLNKATGRDWLKDGNNGTWSVELTSTTETDASSPYSGFMLDNALLEAVGENASTCFDNYKTWLASNALSGENLSSWYIPSYQQILDVVKLGNEVLTEALESAYTDAYFLLSSSVIDDNGIGFKGIHYTPGTGIQKEYVWINPSNHRAIIFPVLTIFE